jgi:hypothetical protein
MTDNFYVIVLSTSGLAGMVLLFSLLHWMSRLGRLHEVR